MLKPFRLGGISKFVKEDYKLANYLINLEDFCKQTSYYTMSINHFKMINKGKLLLSSFELVEVIVPYLKCNN